MTLEQKGYEKGFEKCTLCGCLRPTRALGDWGTPGQGWYYVHVCLERAWCDAQRAAVVSFPKGGGK
jgi:hypothetical protein